MRSPLTRTEKVRLYPTPDQVRSFERTLSICCDLYNAGLQERRAAYQLWRITKSTNFIWPTLHSQMIQFVALRKEWAWIKSEYSEILRDVLKRLDNSFKAFFRRHAAGQNPGYPRFKSKRRYNLFAYSHGGRIVKVFDKTVKLPGIGTVKYRRSGRDIPSKFGVVRIVRIAGKWYACFEYVTGPKIISSTNRQVGVDVGIANFAALSDGILVSNPRFTDTSRSSIEYLQQTLSRCKRGSKRWKKAVFCLATAKQREKNRRIDHAHKFSRQLVNNYDLIAFEDLRVVNMTRSAKGTIEKPGRNVAQKAGLNRSILDAGWCRAMNFTLYKAEEAGRVVKFVVARNTSRKCNNCGYISSENRLTQKSFICISCGHMDHADINAAKNILERARLGLASAA